MQDQLNGLLQKKMDRLTFLKHVGIGFVAFTGVGSIVKTLNGVGAPAKNAAQGYGASAYGGSVADGKRSLS